jgi:hypothetical protein
VPALDVHAVVGEDGLEDVSGLVEIGGLGHDVEAVVVASSRGSDVQATLARRRRHQGQGDVDGVTLVAVLGGGVAEADVLLGVLGWEGHVAVPGLVGHDEGAVGADGLHCPQVSVADRFTIRGHQSSVVRPGRHDIAGTGVLSTTDGHTPIGIKVTAGGS